MNAPAARSLRGGLLVVALLLSGLSAAAPRDRVLSTAERARLLHRWAEEALGDSSLESRQSAVRELKQAIEYEPGNAEHWLLLGRAYVIGGFDGEALKCFRRASVL